MKARKAFFLLILLAACGMAYAQELKIVSFECLERDLLARTQERLDLNDVPCAIVRVSVADASHFTFQGNIIGEVIYQPGEALVYMTANSRYVTINSEKFGSLRFEFPNRLEKQVVYKLTMKLVLSEDQKTRTLVMPVMGVGSTPSYGILVGVVRKYGVYLKAKSDFRGNSTDLVCDDAGLVQEGEGMGSEVWFTGDTRASRFSITAGGLLRLKRPLYLYAGLGYGYKKLAWETVNEVWAENKDHTYKGLEVEAGLIYRYKDYAIMGGLQTNQFNYLEGTIGIGIMF